MIREPRPAIVTGQRSSRGCCSPSSFSLAVRQANRKRAPLLGVEPDAAELLLDVMRQRQVDVVAAEHQVVADGDAPEARAGRRLDDGDQAEVGRAAADVADQDQLARPHLALPAVLVRDDPAVERRLRLLEQRDRGRAPPSWPPRGSARGPPRRTRRGRSARPPAAPAAGSDRPGRTWSFQASRMCRR